MPCHSINVGSAPPHNSCPSARPAMRQRYRPCGLARSAATACPASSPCARSAASVSSSLAQRATMCSSRGRSRSRGQQRGIVQAEPARPGRRRCFGVDGDDLQVGHREGRAADGHQPVVRAHAHVLAAGGRSRTEQLLAPGRALLQRGCSHHQVVDHRTHRFTCPSMHGVTCTADPDLARPATARTPGRRGPAPCPAPPRRRPAPSPRRSATAPGWRSGCR